MKKRIVYLLLAALLLPLLALPTHAAEQATVASGTCGENLRWVLTEDGTLTISGMGKMEDYSSGGTPWYANSKLIRSVIIEDGVTSIGDYAFYDCSSLTGIMLPNSVTSIGNRTFFFCGSLTGITIPNSVTSIDGYAFYGCSNLQNITVSDENQHFSSVDGVLFDKECVTLICCPEGKTGDYAIPMGVTGIGNYAFENCFSLTGITIPDSVTSIGEYAFYLCDSLTSITIPNSVTSIGNSAFAGCGSLKEITVSEGNLYFRSIDGVLFDKECKTLICCIRGKSGDYAIPMGVTSIGEYAFYYCDNLTAITIPDSVTSIGGGAFYCCTSLTSITIPDSVTNIEWAVFEGCSSLTSITIPNSVTSIGGSAFQYCYKLTSITIPDSVTSIDGMAFYDCTNLASITIPNSVTSIGASAFTNCNSLTDVYVLNRETQLDTSEIPAGATIHGYSGSTAEAYAGSHGNKFVAMDNEMPCRVTSVAMNLGNSLSMIFYVPVDNVTDGDYAQITKSYADGRPDVVVKVPLAGAQIKQFNGVNCYLAGFDRIAAKEMNDNVSCVVCHADGTPASKPYNATVKAYAEALLTINDAKLKTLMVDLLNYGAAAQKAFGYDEANPANAGLTEEQKGYATESIDVNNLAHYQNISGIAPAEIALLLKSNTRLMLYYPAAGLNANMVAEITYTDHHGTEKISRVNVSDFGTDKAGKLCLIIDTLLAADYKTVLTVEIYDGENLVSSNEVNLVVYCVLNPGYDASIPLAKYCQAAYSYFHP